MPVNSRDADVALLRAAILQVIDETPWCFYHDIDSTAQDEAEANDHRVEFADRVAAAVRMGATKK